MADEQAMARMRLWWSKLDADTQMMFDKLYRADPANVLEVISDGALTDLDGAATLDAAFTYAFATDGAPDPTSDVHSLPAIVVKDGLVIVEPVAPDAAEAVTVRWTEVNEGAQSQGHLSTVAWLIANQWVEPVQEVIAESMAPGEEAARTASLVGVAAGEHAIYVTANADGNVTGSGAIPAAGIGQMASVYVRVGGGTNRPGSPESANFEGISNARMFLNSALQAVSDPSSLQHAAQALYSFAGSLDTGGEAISGDYRSDPSDERSVSVVQRAQALENLDTGAYADGRAQWERELLAAIEALDQIQADWSSGGAAAYEGVMTLGRESFGLV